LVSIDCAENLFEIEHSNPEGPPTWIRKSKAGALPLADVDFDTLEAVIVEVDESTIRVCKSLNKMLTDLGDDSVGRSPLTYYAHFGVEAAEKAIEFARHCQPPEEDDEPTNPERPAAIEITDFENGFIESLISKNASGEQKFSLYWNVFKTSNHLGITRLIKVMALHVHNTIKNKTPKQICKFFGVSDSLTREQKNELREDLENSLK